MAKGVGFEGANTIFYAPEGMSPDECKDLPAYADGQQIITCWRMEPDDLAEIMKTGVVWVSFQSQGLPPHYVSGTALVTIGDRSSKAEPIIAPARRVEDGTKN